MSLSFHGKNSNILKLTKVTNKTNDKAIINYINLNLQCLLGYQK